MQLDDWVLCRLYNKKGRIEKHYPIDRKAMELPEMEEQKPDIKLSAQNMTMYPQQSPMNNDLLHMDTSDSLPRLHTESSCSEHVLSSPEITYDKEVQSEAKWNELENVFDDFEFNYLDSFQDNPFGSQVQYQMEQLSPLQDMFMLLQKPF